MPETVQKSAFTRLLATFSAGACLLLAAGASAAQASTAGILPPRNPASNCGSAAGFGSIASINACRAREGVGPLTLPGNWAALTPVEQGFVLIDLERVNRGLPPIVGLSAPLNRLASAGAASGNDPSFPADGFRGGGAIWAGAPSVLSADYLWMYDDGPNGSNLDCASAGSSGCWGHRDIMLWDRPEGALVAGGGHSGGAGNDSYAYLILAGYSAANLTFSWSQELGHFAVKPSVEPLGKTAKATRHHHRRTKRRHRRRRTTAASRGSGSGLTISFG